MRSYTRVAPGQAVPYRHRDPEWVTPDVLAELDERDARRERLERGPDPGGQTARRKAAIAEFTRLRKAGMSVPQAADAMGINRSTGRDYERARRRRQ
jgi:hypothetical protein